MNVSSAEGYQIFWKKGSGLNRAQKQMIKQRLSEMWDEVVDSMGYMKKEALSGGDSETRLRLLSHSHKEYFLVVEYGKNAWHLILETDTDCLGEIVGREGQFIKLLGEKEVEPEPLK